MGKQTAAKPAMTPEERDALRQAMRERHMVRAYTDKPLSRETIAKLEERIKEYNKRYKLGIKLMVNDSRAFGKFIKMLLAKNVQNYFIMAGDEAEDLGERLGYCGAELMLYCQTLGLNTWWVSGTFNRNKTERLVGLKTVVGVIAVGYGATQGVPHESKSPEDVCTYESYDGTTPEWFTAGIEAALLAPTARNEQAFFIRGIGSEVILKYDEGFFAGIDTGLVKYHFELGAGTENFSWL